MHTAATASAWVIYTGTGFLLLFLMNFTGNFLDAVLVRVAALLFVSAGLISATGWLGNFISTTFTTVNTAGDQVARSAVGSTIMWLVWFALGLLWFLCLLPHRWFAMAIPDWLSVLGLVLPAGVALIPGPAGVALTNIITTLSHLVATPVLALFGA